jgi:two-component system sensor histidine kinase BaeS
MAQTGQAISWYMALADKAPMKLNIAQKLMVIIMLTTSIVVGLVFGMTRFSILSGFTTYLRKAELAGTAKSIEGDFIAEQSRNLLVVSGVAFVVSAAVAFALSRDLVNAIDKLLKGTARLKAGDLSMRIAVDREDEIGQLAEDFNELAARLQQQDLAKKQWITDTSHELRTPVAVLRAQVEAFQDGVQQPNPRTLEVLHAEIIQLGKLVDDLHDLAKSDLGQLRYNFVPVDVAAVLSDAVDAFSERMASKRIAVETATIDEMSCVIEADGTRLKQLFCNLLENSFRYTSQHGRIRISCQQAPQAVTICFDDSEPGVKPEQLPKLFDRFFRGDQSRSRSHGGAGLGLAICRSIVEAHNGTITAARSELGGVRMTICLPKKELS